MLPRSRGRDRRLSTVILFRPRGRQKNRLRRKIFRRRLPFRISPHRNRFRSSLISPVSPVRRLAGVPGALNTGRRIGANEQAKTL